MCSGCGLQEVGGKSFEAGQTEAKGLGARPSSGTNSGGELGQLTCPFC